MVAHSSSALACLSAHLAARRMRCLRAFSLSSQRVRLNAKVLCRQRASATRALACWALSLLDAPVSRIDRDLALLTAAQHSASIQPYTAEACARLAD